MTLLLITVTDNMKPEQSCKEIARSLDNLQFFPQKQILFVACNVCSTANMLIAQSLVTNIQKSNVFTASSVSLLSQGPSPTPLSQRQQLETMQLWPDLHLLQVLVEVALQLAADL